jgi:hypothetical protein
MLVYGGLFKSSNIVVACCYVQGGAMFSWFLQPYVMHSFNKIASQHVYPFDVIKLLQIPWKKIKPEVEGNKG